MHFLLYENVYETLYEAQPGNRLVSTETNRSFLHYENVYETRYEA